MTTDIALLSPAVGTENVGDHFIGRAILRLLGPGVAATRLTTRRALTDEEVAAAAECDAALLCGTNLYQSDWHAALDRPLLDRLGVPVIPVGVGGSAARLDHVDVGARTADMVRALHERCAAGGVRDPFSVEVVRRLGVENFALTGCPVLFWSGADELPLPDARPRQRVVVTARNWLMHRWPDAVDHPVQVEFLRRVLDGLRDHEVVFAVHESFDLSLLDTLGLGGDGVLVSEDPDDYIALYTDPDNVVLAMRLHAGMLALANGAPAVFVGHDTRTYSFCRMLGLDWIELFADGAAEACLAAVRAALAGDVAAQHAAAGPYRELRGAMAGFLEANGLPSRWTAPVL